MTRGNITLRWRPAMQPRGPWTWQAHRLQRNWYLPAAGLLAIAVGAWLVSRDGRSFAGINGAVLGLFLIWTCPWFALFSLTRNAYPLKKPTRIAVDERSFWLDNEEIPRESLLAGKILPRQCDHAEVRFDRGSSRLSLWMLRKDAEHLLGLLGLGAGQKRTSFALIAPYGARFLAACLPCVPLSLLLGIASRAPGSLPERILSLTPLLAALAGLIASYQNLLQGRAEIGADGVAIRWPWKSTFIPFREIEGVEWKGSLASKNKIHLDGNKFIELCSPDHPVNSDDQGAESRALFEHLQTALELAHRRAGQETDAALPALLSRNGRDAGSWYKNLTSLHNDDYRSESIDPDQLASTVTDADLPADVRAGAAVALLRSPSPEGRKAVRVAIEACADPDLLATLQELEEASSPQEQEVILRRLCR